MADREASAGDGYDIRGRGMDIVAAVQTATYTEDVERRAPAL